MKSKTSDVKQMPAEKHRQNKTLDFLDLYKTADDIGSLIDHKEKRRHSVDSGLPKTKKQETKNYKASTSNKKKNNVPVEVSHISIDGSNLDVLPKNSPRSDGKVTSTPICYDKKNKHTETVKSIMKNSSVVMDDSVEETLNISKYKSKKRNKSVSFMLEDNEEVATKKAKSDTSLSSDSSLKVKNKKSKKDFINKKRNKVKDTDIEKENISNVQSGENPLVKNTSNKERKKSKKNKNELSADTGSEDTVITTDSNSETSLKESKKKGKKDKKKPETSLDEANDTNNNAQKAETSEAKKDGKKKRPKVVNPMPKIDSNGEPESKSRKKDIKPEIIAEDLENLNIGDNPHTLTNLLDDMTVADKNKKKKSKGKAKEKGKQKNNNIPSSSSTENTDLEKIEEGKEKVIWKKRKWNKDKRGDLSQDSLLTSVIVENLPLRIMTDYKKILAKHFGKLGIIKGVGVAELYPNEDPRPVFTTTVNFYSDGAATKALEEDNTVLEGNRIRVKRPLPATSTTLVVRSYGELSEQAVSSAFGAAGRIRSIRHLIKGRKSMSTAFVEFDGPDAVNRAIKMAEDAKIGGKKIHVSKFEVRKGKRQKTDLSETKTNSQDKSSDESDED